MSAAPSQTEPSPNRARPVLVSVRPVADADDALAFVMALQQSGVVVDVQRYEVEDGGLVVALVPTSRDALAAALREAAADRRVMLDGRPLPAPPPSPAEPEAPPPPPALEPLEAPPAPETVPAVPEAPVAVPARPGRAWGLLAYPALAALLLAAAAAFLLQPGRDAPAARSSVPSDAAWSAFVYGRSLAEGARLSFTGEGWDAGFDSPAWSFLLAAGFKLLSPVDPGPVAVGKGLSLLAAAVLVPLAYRLAWALSGRRWAGLLGAALVALDPSVVHAAAGATEAPLLAALLVAALLAVLARRSGVAGLLLAAAVLVRPEGLLFAGLAAAGAAAARCMRPDAGWDRRDSLSLLALAGPPLAAAAAWGAYGLWADGTAVPALWREGGGPAARWGAVWDGYLSGLPYLSLPSAEGWAAVPSALLAAVGAVRAFRRAGPAALPAVAFPPSLVALYLWLGPGGEPWEAAGPRLLVPGLPFALVLLAAGVPGLWYGLLALRRRWLRAVAPGPWRGFAALAVLSLLALSLLGLPAAFARGVEEYAALAAAVRDLGTAPAAEVARRAAPGDAVAAFFPGATAYRTGLGVLDLRGRDVTATLAAARPRFAVLPPAARWRDEPAAEPLATFAAEEPWPGLPEPLTLYRFEWDRPLDATDVPWGFDPAGLEPLDRLDVGEPLSELAHGYSVEGAAPLAEVTARTTGERAVADAGRTLAQGASHVFTMPVGSRRDLTLVTRYDGSQPGRLRLFVNGRRVSDWPLPPSDFRLGVTWLTIPPLFLLDPQPFIEVRLEVVAAPEGGVTLFHHWLYQRPADAVPPPPP